ncbi:unnamed protein product [Protopolystoma xenopodis]|uniref:Uncharacterized protein n=1 Tax=Protopolystoma xenopodis TaxID=117903 RepID=A0A3S5A108_9PLAT|nr:unnamed protein product [Protopolystoma xenopodis]
MNFAFTLYTKRPPFDFDLVILDMSQGFNRSRNNLLFCSGLETIPADALGCYKVLTPAGLVVRMYHIPPGVLGSYVLAMFFNVDGKLSLPTFHPVTPAQGVKMPLRPSRFLVA